MEEIVRKESSAYTFKINFSTLSIEAFEKFLGCPIITKPLHDVCFLCIEYISNNMLDIKPSIEAETILF